MRNIVIAKGEYTPLWTRDFQLLVIFRRIHKNFIKFWL